MKKSILITSIVALISILGTVSFAGDKVYKQDPASFKSLCSSPDISISLDGTEDQRLINHGKSIEIKQQNDQAITIPVGEDNVARLDVEEQVKEGDVDLLLKVHTDFNLISDSSITYSGKLSYIFPNKHEESCAFSGRFVPVQQQGSLMKVLGIKLDSAVKK